MAPPSVTEPEPTIVTPTGNVAMSKLAVTVAAAFIVTVHVPVPEQPPPLQPVNIETGTEVLGEAVRVTTVPSR